MPEQMLAGRGGPFPSDDRAPVASSEADTVRASLLDELASAASHDRPGGGAAPLRYDELPTIGHVGRYALKYRLGGGGLGTVHAAQDPLLSRLVAIKTLSVELSPDAREQFNAMFLNEGRAAAGLNHPHIVTVFDAGTSDQGGYIAMELLKGKDLRQLLKEGWRPSPMESALIVRRAADALAYAHSKGVVHRDVKPANIFMTGRTQPKLLDFGLARVASQQDDANSGGADFAAGSPYYMAPEQVRHAVVDRRCDVFSLGVVLYELLTGTKPFTGSTLSEIATAVLTHTPPPAHAVNPTVPEALSGIVARAMQKEPDNRFRSARALSRELRHWIAEQSDAVQQDELDVAQRRARRRRWAGAAAAATLLMLGVGLFVGSSAYRPSDAAEAAKATEVADSEVVAVMSSTAGQEPRPDAAAAGPQSQASNGAAATGSSAAKAKAGPGDPTQAARDKQARRARDRAGRSPDANSPSAAATTGQVNLAVSPWGHVEVDGTHAGTVPPVSKLTLSEGRHTITIRNDDFAPHTVTITVTPDQPITVRHKFGS